MGAEIRPLPVEYKRERSLEERSRSRNILQEVADSNKAFYWKLGILMLASASVIAVIGVYAGIPR